jgi:diguanylate cyclase (GGDEF)-like protein
MLGLYLRIDINLISMFLLAIVFLIAYKRLDKKDIINKVYLITIIVVIIQLGVEALTCIINGRDGQILRYTNIFLHVLLFIIAPILSSGWYLLIRTFITPNTKISTRKLYLIFSPVLVNTIFALLTPFFNFYFDFDQFNLYTRGQYFIVGVIITYLYLFLSIIYLIKYRKNIILQEFILLLIFIFLPIIGGVIQGLFYGVLLMWSSAAFGLMIVYIYLQERLIHLDDLTGTWTRRSFDYYINKKINTKQMNPFGAIFFDIDNLKVINDNFGHFEGDHAIKEIITRVKGLLIENEVIARIGGDEFIIITKEGNQRLENLINDIKLSLSVFNENSNKDYQLSCSYGYGEYKEDFKTIDQFLRFIDYRMYENKSKTNE